MSHSAIKNILNRINAKLIVILLVEVGQKKIENAFKKTQANGKLRLAEPPLERLSPVSSYQTRKTVSGDTPPHIAL